MKEYKPYIPPTRNSESQHITLGFDCVFVRPLWGTEAIGFVDSVQRKIYFNCFMKYWRLARLQSAELCRRLEPQGQVAVEIQRWSVGRILSCLWEVSLFLIGWGLPTLQKIIRLTPNLLIYTLISSKKESLHKNLWVPWPSQGDTWN